MMTDKLKILVFVENFAYPTYTFIYNELITLSKSNEVLIFTTNRINSKLFPFTNIEVFPFYSGELDYRVRKTLRARDIWIASKKESFKYKIQELLQLFDPDIIHCHFGYESWLFLSNYPVGKIPVFLHFHGFDASHKLKSQRYCNILKNLFLRPDLTPIFVSKFMHRGIEQAIEQKVNKWSLLYYGTDCNFFARQFKTKSNNHYVFLQISSFAEKKGHEYTISAFSKFIRKNSNMNCKLILAGEGELKDDIKKRVQDLDLKSYVDFPGLVNKSEAKELMESADCFLHHSITSSTRGDMEGIPNAIMEAMAMELPIISTFHAGIPELVEDGVNGLLVNERDVDAYAEAMNRILTWDYLPQNRAKIEAYFEKEKHGKLLVQYYEDAIEEMKKHDI